MSPVIDELEVLIGTTLWLHRQQWEITAISIPRRNGTVVTERLEAFRSRIAAAGVTYRREPQFFSDGPDIVATRGDTEWKIECKGLGTGAKSTLFTQFQRGVGSVVSYFDGPTVRLGLSLPEEYLFDHKWGRRLPRQFRQACNLWVLVYSEGEIFAHKPDSELPPD